NHYTLADVQALLELMESRKPTSLNDLIEHIPIWLEALRHQIEVAAGPKPFFSQDIERMHGGGGDQRRHDGMRLTGKENEVSFLGRLEKILEAGSMTARISLIRGKTRGHRPRLQLLHARSF